MFGMTGTLGGIKERSLIADVYDIDYFELPRFKDYRFEYDGDSESVSTSIQEWL